MQRPHISGRVLFTPFFQGALDELRQTVETTLGAPHITLEKMTSGEPRYWNLRLAAVKFIAALAARSGLTFPTGYNKDKQFALVTKMMAEALNALRMAILALDRRNGRSGLVARPAPPRRLGFV